MAEDTPIPVYEVPPDALKRPWVDRSFLALRAALRSRPSHRIGSSLFAGLISLSLHALLIGSVILGVARVPTVRPPQEQGPGSTGIVSTETPVMTLILISEPSTTSKESIQEPPLASVGFAPADRLVALLSATPDPAFDTEEKQDPNSANMAAPASDIALRALLFGRYVGQIRARIERAWMRPRTPIGAASFDCRVQIVQDKRGNAIETTLQDCNGGSPWQSSLVQAIQSASPLPAPPDPRVFANAIVLTFHAYAYVPGGSEEGFEPERIAVGGASTEIQPGTARHRKRPDGSLDLSITGSASNGAAPLLSD